MDKHLVRATELNSTKKAMQTDLYHSYKHKYDAEYQQIILLPKTRMTTLAET